MNNQEKHNHIDSGSEGESNQDNPILPHGNEVEPELKDQNKETKTEQPSQEFRSPYPTDHGIAHAELYDFEWSTTNHEIIDSGNGLDLFSNGKFIGENIAAGENMDASFYYAAVEDAYRSGSGEWHSEDDTNLYLGIIVRNESGTYDWYSYRLNKETLAAAQEEKIDEQSDEEPEPTPIVIAEIPLPIPATEVLNSLQTFTLNDLKKAFELNAAPIVSAEEVLAGTAEEESQEEYAGNVEEHVATSPEILTFENSDVTLSGENVLQTNSTSTETAVSLSESLSFPEKVVIQETVSEDTLVETVQNAVANQEVITDQRLITELKNDSDVLVEEPVLKIEAIQSEPQFVLFEEFHSISEKNEAIYSLITNEIETTQVIAPVELQRQEQFIFEDLDILITPSEKDLVAEQLREQIKQERAPEASVLELPIEEIVPTAEVAFESQQHESVQQFAVSDVQEAAVAAKVVRVVEVATHNIETIEPVEPQSPDAPAPVTEQQDLESRSGIRIVTTPKNERVFEEVSTQINAVVSESKVNTRSVREQIFAQTGISIVRRTSPSREALPLRRSSPAIQLQTSQDVSASNSTSANIPAAIQIAA